jgi:hypothetical protein
MKETVFNSVDISSIITVTAVNLWKVALNDISSIFGGGVEMLLFITSKPTLRPCQSLI